MYIKLTNSERLKDLRLERGLTLKDLAEQTGLSQSALGSYETDEGKEISPHSVTTLAKFYGVSADYLLGLTENKNPPAADLYDLHLSDEMIALLKSGKINNRLLCEIATHGCFPRFMADVEIFVDRIADMRVNDMNTVLSNTRNTLMERRGLPADDLYVRTLELAQVREEDYFSHVMQKDLDAITHDIREAHRQDTTTADTASPVADLQQRFQAALSFEGTMQEKMARLFLSQLGISFDKLTKEERTTFVRILSKADMLKSPYNNRGNPVIKTAKE